MSTSWTPTAMRGVTRISIVALTACIASTFAPEARAKGHPVEAMTSIVVPETAKLPGTPAQTCDAQDPGAILKYSVEVKVKVESSRKAAGKRTSKGTGRVRRPGWGTVIAELITRGAELLSVGHEVSEQRQQLLAVLCQLIGIHKRIQAEADRSIEADAALAETILLHEAKVNGIAVEIETLITGRIAMEKDFERHEQRLAEQAATIERLRRELVGVRQRLQSVFSRRIEQAATPAWRMAPKAPPAQGERQAASSLEQSRRAAVDREIDALTSRW